MIIAARAPNHLGDGVMALPAMHGLARLGRLVIHAPRWGQELYRDVAAVVRPCGAMEADVAVLFAPSLRAAREARGCPVRVGAATDFRGMLLTRVVPLGGHRASLYGRLCRAAGGVVDGVPAWTSRHDDPRVDVSDGHFGLNPISPSGAVVQWPGFSALARRLEGPVVFYGGPGEGAAVAAVAGGFDRQVGLSLSAFGCALTRCAAFISNDSGAAHFARACGVPTVVVYGSTSPHRTGPDGAVAVEGPPVGCRPCYRKRCWQERGCLAIPVHLVQRAIGVAVG